MRLSYFYDMPLPSRYAAAIQILRTCHELAQQGVAATVLVRHVQGSLREVLAAYGLEPHPLLQIQPFFGTVSCRISARWTLHRFLRECPRDEPHIIVSRGECGISFFDRLRKHGSNAKHHRWVYEAHRLCAGADAHASEGHLNMPLEDVRKLENAAVCGAAGLICLTPAVESALRELYPLTAPVLILPSGTTLPSGPLPDDDSRDIDIIYAGKLERRKGIMELLRAMQHLPEYRAHVAGGSPSEVASLRAEAAALGVEERIHFLGFVEPARTEELYARARVGICPLPAGESMVSEQFTSPLKLLSMMAWGVPAIATAVPSVERIVQHEVSAWLVPPGDSAALAQAIRRLLQDRRLAARLALAAREAAREYSWEHRARRLKEFVEGLR